MLIHLTRCTATPDNLEGDSILRCREHTELLVETFELGVLWDEYGIVGDVVVSSLFLPFQLDASTTGVCIMSFIPADSVNCLGVGL